MNNVEQNVAQVPEMRLEAGARLIYITYYIKCGDEITEEKTIDEKLLAAPEVNYSSWKDWEITDFTPRK